MEKKKLFNLIIQQEEIVKPLKYIIIGAIGLSLIFAAERVTAEKTGPGALQRAIIKIDTLSCGGCFNTISEGLSPLKGYSGMGMNLFRKLIAVDFTEPLTVEEISQKLSEVGYPGTVETVEPVSDEESFAYLDQKITGAGGSCCMLPKTSQPTEE